MRGSVGIGANPVNPNGDDTFKFLDRVVEQEWT